jgi:dihydroflavonol-4-reductase
MVYVSSAAAIGGTPTPIPLDEQSPFTLAGENLPYAWAKHRAEALVLSAADADFAVVVVNPAEVYGADDRDWITAGAIRDILRGWPAVAVRGGTSVVHVTDVATGIVAALAQGRSGERYILGGDNLSFAELVRLVLELAALRRPVVTLPFWLLRAAVRASLALGLPPPVEPGLLGYLDRYWFMDSAKARRELGFRPRPARAVLEPVVRWVGEQDRVAAQQRWVTRTTGATG